MSENSSYPNYCNQPKFKGATCLREDLELLEIVEDVESETYVIKESIYKCRVCEGIYKYCLFEKDETRNLDCDPGWWTVLDRFFKVEEIYATEPKLTIAEARRYGFAGEDFTLKNNRCNYPETPSGLTCRPGSIKFFRWILPDKTDLYDPQFYKCRRCGQLYKKLWNQSISFQYVKISDEDYLKYFS